MNNPYSISEQEAEAVANKAHERVAGIGMGDMRIGLLIRFANARLLERLAQLLAPNHLTPSAYFAMIALYGGENLANPSELCAITGETRGNMTRICDDLVQKGWLKRVENPADRRRVDLSLSDTGVALLQEVMPGLRGKMENALEVFSTEEKTIFIGLLTRLNQRLESLT